MNDWVFSKHLDRAAKAAKNLTLERRPILHYLLGHLPRNRVLAVSSNILGGNSNVGSVHLSPCIWESNVYKLQKVLLRVVVHPPLLLEAAVLLDQGRSHRFPNSLLWDKELPPELSISLHSWAQVHNGQRQGCCPGDNNKRSLSPQRWSWHRRTHQSRGYQSLLAMASITFQVWSLWSDDFLQNERIWEVKDI